MILWSENWGRLRRFTDLVQRLQGVASDTWGEEGGWKKTRFLAPCIEREEGYAMTDMLCNQRKCLTAPCT